MPLAVAEAQRVGDEALGLGDREHGGRIETTAEEDNCFLSHLRLLPSVRQTAGTRPPAWPDYGSSRTARQRTISACPGGSAGTAQLHAPAAAASVSSSCPSRRTARRYALNRWSATTWTSRGVFWSSFHLRGYGPNFQDPP